MSIAPANRALLAEVLREKSIERVLVFTRTKRGADKVVRALAKAGLAAEAIHGNKSQSQRERVLAAFRDRPGAHAGRHRHRGTRHRRRRHQPRHQLRSAEHSGELRASHRPHRARRRRRDRDLVLRGRGAAVPARHREAHPDVDPGRPNTAQRSALAAQPRRASITPMVHARVQPQRKQQAERSAPRPQRTQARPQMPIAIVAPRKRPRAAHGGEIGAIAFMQPKRNAPTSSRRSMPASERRGNAIGSETNIWPKKSCSNSTAR